MNAACRLALPSPRSADTNVVSIASWAPPKRGNPSATTSNLRLSVTWKTVSRSLTKTLVETLAPASRHTLAAADSKAAPLPPRTPDTVQDRWWPKMSGRRTQRQTRTAKGRGRRNRRNNMTLNGWGSIRTNLDVGTQANGHAAGPGTKKTHSRQKNGNGTKKNIWDK